MSNTNYDTAKKTGLTRVIKYWRHISYVEIELDWLNNWIFVLVIFVKYPQRVYNNKK